MSFWKSGKKSLTNIQMGFFNIRGIVIIAYRICVFNRYFGPAYVNMSYKTRINSIPLITNIPTHNHFYPVVVAFHPCIRLRFVENVCKIFISINPHIHFHLHCTKKYCLYTHSFSAAGWRFIFYSFDFSNVVFFFIARIRFTVVCYTHRK